MDGFARWGESPHRRGRVKRSGLPIAIDVSQCRLAHSLKKFNHSRAHNLIVGPVLGLGCCGLYLRSPEAVRVAFDECGTQFGLAENGNFECFNGTFVQTLNGLSKALGEILRKHS
jgi:hypothetical protein